MISLKESGFKNLRDLLCFLIGGVAFFYYLISTLHSGDHINLGVLGLFAGFMGLPVAFNADERKKGR